MDKKNTMKFLSHRIYYLLYLFQSIFIREEILQLMKSQINWGEG